MIERGRGNGCQSYPDYLDLRDRNRSFDGLGSTPAKIQRGFQRNARCRLTL